MTDNHISYQFKSPKYELFVCDCGDVNHQFVAIIDESEEPPDVYVEVRLNRYLGFWHRLINSIRYLFKIGNPSRFGDYDCVLLNKSHVKGFEKIIEALNKHQE